MARDNATYPEDEILSTDDEILSTDDNASYPEDESIVENATFEEPIDPNHPMLLTEEEKAGPLGQLNPEEAVVDEAINLEDMLAHVDKAAATSSHRLNRMVGKSQAAHKKNLDSQMEMEKNTLASEEEQIAELKEKIEAKKIKIDEVRAKERELNNVKQRAYEGAREKQQQLINQFNEISNKNPFKSVFGGSLGIAANVFGALNQALFGGENRAQAFLMKQVDAEVNRLTNKMHTLKSISTVEDRTLQLVLDSNQTAMERQNALRVMVLEDYNEQVGMLETRYGINLAKKNIGLKYAALYSNASAELLTKAISQQPDTVRATADVVNTFMRNRGMGQATKATMLRAANTDDVENTPKETQDRFDNVLGQLQLAGKAMDIASKTIFKDMPSETKSRLMDYVMGMSPEPTRAMIMDIDKYLIDPLRDEKNKGKWRKKMSRLGTLYGTSMNRAYLEITKEQNGRLTYMDFVQGWKRFMKPHDDPALYLKSLKRHMQSLYGKLNSEINRAASQRSRASVIGDKGGSKFSNYQQYIASVIPLSGESGIPYVESIASALKQSMEPYKGKFPDEFAKRTFFKGKAYGEGMMEGYVKMAEEMGDKGMVKLMEQLEKEPDYSTAWDRLFSPLAATSHGGGPRPVRDHSGKIVK
jgi:hypothetical protein